MEHNFKLTMESMPGTAVMLNVLGSLIFLCGIFFPDYMRTKGKTQPMKCYIVQSLQCLQKYSIFFQGSLQHYLDRAGNLTNDIC